MQPAFSFRENWSFGKPIKHPPRVAKCHGAVTLSASDQAHPPRPPRRPLGLPCALLSFRTLRPVLYPSGVLAGRLGGVWFVSRFWLGNRRKTLRRFLVQQALPLRLRALALLLSLRRPPRPSRARLVALARPQCR